MQSIQKSLVISFVTITSIIASLVAASISGQYRIIDQASRIEGVKIAQAVAYTGLPNVTDKTDYLKEYVRGLHAIHKRDIVFMNRDHLILADADPADIGTIYKADSGNEIALTMVDGVPRTFTEPPKLGLTTNSIEQIVVPLYANADNQSGPISGAVIVEYTQIKNELLSHVRTNLFVNLALGLLCILLSIYIALRVLNRISTPLKDLRSAVLNLSNGDFSTRIIVKKFDEIGQLGDAFNAMAAQISRQLGVDAKNVALTSEINDLALTKANLMESEQRYRQLVELSPDAICIEIRGIIVFANQACVRLLGADNPAELVGTPVSNFVHQDSVAIAKMHRDVVKSTQQPSVPLELKLRRKDGALIDVEGVGGPFTYEGKPATQLLVREITERKQIQEKLSYLAHYDALTRLPNRSLFQERLRRGMANARRHANLTALLFLDLDRFKEINDSLGHSVGDEVLQEVAHRLSALLREVDTLARLGGDEFTIILEGIDDRAEAGAVAQRVLDVLSKPITVKQVELFVSASIGIAFYKEDSDTADELTQAADVAMYQAKENGRNAFVFFDAKMGEFGSKRIQMTGLLRHAVERNQFFLLYQPKINIKTGEVAGMEALLRWNSPELGLVMPNDFIPIAEESGSILQIGEWVLREACRQTREWQVSGLKELIVSVNLSARQFQQAELVGKVCDVLRTSGLSARCLELEITETMVMRDAEHSADILHKLNALGIALSIDDFGTGYSSLAYLKKFTVQKLKIDRSFIRDIVTDRDDASIVKAILSMATSLGLEVVAEGVENTDQLNYLRALDCAEYQGYLFSKPIDSEAFYKLVKATRKSVLIKA